MGIRNKRFVLIFIFLFSFLGSLKAQVEPKPQALSEVFNTIQKQFNIQFNYSEDLINTIEILPPSSDLSIEDTLLYLRQNTGLDFNVIQNNFILVSSNKGVYVCGYIRDKQSLLPLSSATIQGFNSATTSDDSGFFRLALNDLSEAITIRYLGYTSKQLLYSDFVSNVCSDVLLEIGIESLSEIIVSSYLVKGIDKLSDGSLRIDFSEFDILPGLLDHDVLQSIQAFPGVQSTNETVSNINIRGGTNDQNLILWDDIKMYQSGHFFGLISMYNPHITQNVSLYKNGTDVSYTDGVSGTISMKTENNVNSKFKGNIGINFIDANGFADLPIGKKSSLQVAARKSISDFLETPTYSNFFERISQDTEVDMNTNNSINTDKAFDFYDVSLRWIYKFSPKDELRINFINVGNELMFNENGLLNNLRTTKQSSLTQASIAGGLYYDRVWNSKFTSELEVYETDYKLKAINENIENNQRFLQENVVSETSVKLKTNYRLNDRFELTNGYQFVETEVTNLDDVDTPVFRLLVSEVVRTHGVFSQLGFMSDNASTNFKFGLRYNYIDKFGKHLWEPRLSLSQKFFKHFTIEVLGEMKHQNTSQIINFQNDFLGIEKRRWQLSNNSSIPVIKSQQMSVGIHYDTKSWLIGVETYIKHIDGITSQSQGFQNQYEFLKASGSYEVFGVDAILKKTIQKFNTWLSYSFMDNVYTFNTLEENTFPSNYNITHAITFGTAYTSKHLKISAGVNWHSGKPKTLPVEGSEIDNDAINFSSTNSSNLKDYFRVDVSALYNFNLGTHHKASIGASIWNVFDRKNEINNYYRINSGSVNETIQSSLGFTPNVMLRVDF